MPGVRMKDGCVSVGDRVLRRGWVWVTEQQKRAALWVLCERVRRGTELSRIPPPQRRIGQPGMTGRNGKPNAQIGYAALVWLLRFPRYVLLPKRGREFMSGFSQS